MFEVPFGLELTSTELDPTWFQQWAEKLAFLAGQSEGISWNNFGRKLASEATLSDGKTTTYEF